MRHFPSTPQLLDAVLMSHRLLGRSARHETSPKWRSILIVHEPCRNLESISQLMEDWVSQLGAFCFVYVRTNNASSVKYVKQIVDTE